MVSILDGNIPPNLTITKLREGFPLDWKQQRKYLEFAEFEAPNVTRQNAN
jgi:hypothetical protein